MNFGMGKAGGGVQTEEADGHRIMDHGLDLGLNFFDTANVYGDGRGLTESIIGRWFAQGDRRRERTVLATKVYNSRDQWPNSGRLSALRHPARVRGQPQAAADRLHRPVPDAPRRPRHAVGRDLAGDGRAGAAGQGALRRQQQLRRLAHRAGQRGGDAPRLAGPRVGAEPLQPQRPHHRARGAARVRALRGRHDPVEPARRWPARRRARRPRGRRPARRPAGPGPDRGHAPAARAVGEVLRRARPRARRRRAGVAARQPRRHRADHRPAHGRAGRRRHGCARRGARRRRARRASTRSSPAPAVPRPRRTPGDERAGDRGRPRARRASCSPNTRTTTRPRSWARSSTPGWRAWTTRSGSVGSTPNPRCRRSSTMRSKPPAVGTRGSATPWASACAGRRSWPAAPASSRSGSCGRSSPPRRSGASSSVSRARAPTSPGCRPGPCATATSGS